MWRFCDLLTYDVTYLMWLIFSCVFSVQAAHLVKERFNRSTWVFIVYDLSWPQCPWVLYVWMIKMRQRNTAAICCKLRSKMQHVLQRTLTYSYYDFSCHITLVTLALNLALFNHKHCSGQRRSLLTTLWPSCRRQLVKKDHRNTEKMKLQGDLGRHWKGTRCCIRCLLEVQTEIDRKTRKRHCYSNRKMALEWDSKALTCQHFQKYFDV